MNVRALKFSESALSPREMVAMLLEDEPQIDPMKPGEDFIAFIKRRHTKSAARLKRAMASQQPSHA